MARITALSLAVLLALFEIGSCTRCYQCNSQNDPTCGEPFKSTRSVDCATQDAVSYNQLYLKDVLPLEMVSSSVLGAPRYCSKIVMQTGTIVRTCLDVNPSQPNHICTELENFSKTNTVPAKKIKQCSMCNKDNCNGASSVSFSLPLAALALIASYLYAKQ